MLDPPPIGLGVFSSPVCRIGTAPQPRAAPSVAAAPRVAAAAQQPAADASEPRKHGARGLPFKKFIVNDDNLPPKPQSLPLQIT